MTIAPVDHEFTFYVNGREFSKRENESVAWPNVGAMHWVYYDADAVLRVSADNAVVSDVIAGSGALVAALLWDTTEQAVLLQFDERHSSQFPASVHWYLHRYFGMLFASGGTLANFTYASGNASLAAHVQYAIADCVVADEDLPLSIQNGVNQTLSPIARLPVFYMLGSGVWHRKVADEYPLIYSGTAGYTGANGLPPYNQLNGSTWQLTQVANGNFFCVHVVATKSRVEPIIAVQGQATYTTIAAARAGARTEIDALAGVTRLSSMERRAIATVIYESQSGATNVPRAKIVANDLGTYWLDWRTLLRTAVY
jgi:hypothetical protein